MSSSFAKPGQMEASVIAEVSSLVMKITGVQLGVRQRVMVETRLRRRISDLGLANEHEYLQHLRSNLAEETEALVSLLTTHHTFFFREFQHFQYLEDGALRTLVRGVRARGEKKLRVWSAACSRGQEVYSLAMFLKVHLPKIDPEMQFEILGTDVDTESVAIAQNGVFHRREIKQAPLMYLADYWAKGNGDIAEYVKAKKTLRDHCSFKPANLLKYSAFSTFGRFDLILCRNVFIYFTPEQIEKISLHLSETLHPEGLFMIGISESLNGLNLPLKTVGPSVYQRVQGRLSRSEAAPSETKLKDASAKLSQQPATAAEKPEIVQPAGPLRVVCVDDSPSVLAVLKQVLQEKSGFKVIGTAGNGLEAVKVIKDLKPDLVTLDIHMPEATGLEYLRRNWHKDHPPVVVVSSVAREDASLALQCLAAGAADYVEKPALANLAERGDELRMKLVCADRRRQSKPAPSQLDQQMSGSLPSTLRTKAAIVIIAGLSDQQSVSKVLKELRTAAVSICILTEGIGGALPAMGEDLQRQSGSQIKLMNADQLLETGAVYLGDLATHWPLVSKNRQAGDTSILIFGDLSDKCKAALAAWRGAQVLLEDLLRRATTPEWITDVVPATSFAYMARIFLAQKKVPPTTGNAASTIEKKLSIAEKKPLMLGKQSKISEKFSAEKKPLMLEKQSKVSEKFVTAKADCLMTSFDGDIILFNLRDEILITAVAAGKGCAFSIESNSLTLSQVNAALRKIETFLKATSEQCEIKILGSKLSISRYLDLAPQRLKHAKVVAKEGFPLAAIFYPKTGRLRVAEVGESAAAPASFDSRKISSMAGPARSAPEKETPRLDKAAQPRPGKIRVLIVDDSLTIRKLLSKVLSEDPGIEVVAALEKPSEVEAAIDKFKPDVLTLDIHMPEMNGVTLLKKIMPKRSIPTVMITSVSMEEGPMVLEALEAGAVDYIQKPSMEQLLTLAPLIVEKIKTAAIAKVHTNQKTAGSPARLRSDFRASSSLGTLIAIGSSTGGTEALKDLLLRMPESIPPILIVQHIPPVFSRAFAQRLNSLCPFEVQEAADGDVVRAGRVLVAPGGKQMRLKKAGQGYVVEVFDGPPVNRHKPSVDVLFDSVAEIAGPSSLGVILTGMGADGAKGLLKMRQAGSRTIAQDEASCVVFGMPREAIALGAAEKVVHLYQIPECLLTWLKESNAPSTRKRVS